ncbi:FAD:protein FMN transferase [Edaphocola aurantiacus]|uniref:FAD:protein FMN transferase n=1 Tax=Edaphocola aurantiacus TaxID=2601682 RepID=UPI001C97C820|nr:FAD:protein FMN transferase [Edaphocola aurantiacus]
MQLKAYHKSIASMTSYLDITIVAAKQEDDTVARLMEGAYAIADHWIGIISAWQEGTELYQVNQQAGIAPVRVCKALFDLLKRSIRISEWTGGLFDVTFASIDKVWYFDRPMTTLPTTEAIMHSIRNIDYRFIDLNEVNQSVFIRNKGTKIELGAIGKGFIANKMKEYLISKGVHSGIVNAGGDLTAWGKNEQSETWKIAVADPEKKERFIAWMPLTSGGIATSGSYERYALIDGKRYAHIIHPQTGYPVSGLKSVTIVSPDVELCDAIATSVFLLGKEEGLAFVNQHPELKCFIVDDEGAYHYSDNLKSVHYTN